jgi:hypothetical protein
MVAISKILPEITLSKPTIPVTLVFYEASRGDVDEMERYHDVQFPTSRAEDEVSKALVDFLMDQAREDKSLDAEDLETVREDYETWVSDINHTHFKGVYQIETGEESGCFLITNPKYKNKSLEHLVDSIQESINEITVGPEQDKSFIYPEEDDTLLSWFQANGLRFTFTDKGAYGSSSKVGHIFGDEDDLKLSKMLFYLEENNPEMKVKEITAQGAYNTRNGNSVRIVTKQPPSKTPMFPPQPPVDPNTYHYTAISEIIKIKDLLS